MRHCHTLTQPHHCSCRARGRSDTQTQRYATAAPCRIDGVAPASYGATTDTRPVNTAEYERLLGDAVSGIERTEALGHTTLGKIRRQHETIGYAARRTMTTRSGSRKTPKKFGVILQLLREIASTSHAFHGRRPVLPVLRRPVPEPTTAARRRPFGGV